MAPDGRIVPHVHQYTELATGLNHLVNGQWVASKENIEISPDGISAMATNGQHQAYFPNDIATGVIKLVTPDEEQLFSRPIALGYDDGTNTVLIGLLTNSVGELAGSNQVIYPNAFEGVSADLRYTYTKAGFEQDVVLADQPPPPGRFGFNPQAVRLQVITEFFNPPQPVQTAGPAGPQDDLQDTALAFGQMKMVRGRAFAIGQSQPFGLPFGGTPTYKRWLNLQGRTFLIEDVPYHDISSQLQALPANATTSIPVPGSALYKVSSTRLLPPATSLKAAVGNDKSKIIRLASGARPAKGYVLDYVTVNSETNAITFQGDTTYYISGYVFLYGVGTCTIEGGTVIKFARGAGLDFAEPLSCKTSPYRPAVLTAMDDDTVGQAISGSTGSPTGTYADIAIAVDGTVNLTPIENLRVLYANWGVAPDVQNTSGNPGVPDILRNCQFINDAAAILPQDDLTVENVLFDNVDTAFQAAGSGTVNVAFATAHHVNTLNSGCDLNITNSLFICVTNEGDAFSGDHNYTNSSDTGIFQTVGAGSHYLATNSPYRNAGTTNIAPAALADIQTRTTYPPTVITNENLTNSVTWPVQAQRDTDTPDLGYHYDPIDYAVSDVTVETNATLNLTNGVAVAGFGQYGLFLNSGSQVNSVGTPQVPNQICTYQAVQEQPTNWGGTTPPGMFTIYIIDPSSSNPAILQAQFTDFNGIGGLADMVFGDPMILNLKNCQVGPSNIGCWVDNSSLTNQCVNNLFERTQLVFGDGDGWPYASALIFDNNLVRYGSLTFYRYLSSTPAWIVRNNLFDTTTLTSYVNSGASPLTEDHNGYVNTTQLTPTNANDVAMTNFTYAAGPLGNYYQASTNLLNMGSTTAAALGLYHYTVLTNQVPEGINTVSIGYHYVATDQYGNPLDTDGDGVPDYLEDANGNGLVDNGENSWTNYNSANGLTGANGLVVFTPLK